MVIKKSSDDELESSIESKSKTSHTLDVDFLKELNKEVQAEFQAKKGFLLFSFLLFI
jgi:hypothetical protein